MPDTTKILVIDDNEDDRFLYRRTLRADTAATYLIVEKDNGEEGFNCIAEENPACILLDYSLPGRNGLEVLKRIRAQYPFVAVLMLTGQGNEAVAVSAMREGAQHYLSKSAITSETLQRSVRVAIEHCELQRRIDEQRSSLEMFTRALAHDLKEPVRTIRSFLDLIGGQTLPADKVKKYFEYIQRAAERMSGLIDTVYFYMRLDNSEQKITEEPNESRQALEDAKSNLAALIRDRKAVITADPLPLVYANRMQLIQVMQNLISNAIQHSPNDPVIHISAHEEENMWVFSVKDNGPGIAPEYQKRIFEPFKRLVRHKEDGLGLGLSICKKIVEAAGGKIWCESTPPYGTTFHFSFPKVNTLSSMANGFMPAHTDQVHVTDDNEALASLLIVEDNDADIELTRLTLLDQQKLRCRLFVAHNGYEALTLMNDKAATGNPIDFVLLDINMPGMDGFELLTQMRATKKMQNIPVAMCTTSTYDKDIAHAKELGAAAYLIKPLDFRKFKPIIETMTSLSLHPTADGYNLTRTLN